MNFLVEPVAFVLVGENGAGKTTICNLLCKQQVFRAEFSSTSVTTAMQHHVFEGGNHVVDTPGLNHTDNLSNGTIKQQIHIGMSNVCAKQVVGGVFGVGNGGRINASSVEVVQMLQRSYGITGDTFIAVVNCVEPQALVAGTYQEDVKNVLVSQLPWIKRDRIVFLPKLDCSPVEMLTAPATETFRIQARRLLDASPRVHHIQVAPMETVAEIAVRRERELAAVEEARRVEVAAAEAARQRMEAALAEQQAEAERQRVAHQQHLADLQRQRDEAEARAIAQHLREERQRWDMMQKQHMSLLHGRRYF